MRQTQVTSLMFENTENEPGFVSDCRLRQCLGSEGPPSNKSQHADSMTSHTDTLFFWLVHTVVGQLPSTCQPQALDHVGAFSFSGFFSILKKVFTEFTKTENVDNDIQ